MLVRLISAREVVILCSDKKVRLFYRGKVYSRPVSHNFEDLPSRQKTRYCRIWTLIDADEESGELFIPRDANIWPLLACSPKSSRWTSWFKQYGASLLGMPLWTVEELLAGYVFDLFFLSAIDSGYVVRQRFAADFPAV